MRLSRRAGTTHWEVDMEQGTVRLTRRSAIAGAAAALGGMALAPIAAVAGADEISHSAEAIHQEVAFKAGRQRVYAALTDAKLFSEVIKRSAAVKSGVALGDKATEVSQTVGGRFVIFGGHIIGRQIELVRNERIVQAWRVVDWDPGVYSIARFALSDNGPGTKLVFDHVGFPEGQAQHLADGWKANYWEPLAEFLS
jgi:activator of HSP90 ATPase